MVPPKTNPRWAALLQGSFEYKFTRAAASMMLFQLKWELRKNPSPEALADAIDAMHAFCTKYERILQQDLSMLFN